MPAYVYQCKNHHQVEVIHSMFDNPRTWCGECGEEMHRRPQKANVKWSSFIQPSPAVAQHLATVDQQRDEYLRTKEGPR